MKLNVKVGMMVGILSFIISFSIGQYANSISTKQLEENSGKALEKLASRVADVLDREMLERYREIRFASALSVMTDEAVSKEEKRAFIDKIQKNYDHHRWIGYALPDGTLYVGSNGYLEGKNVKARPWHPAGLKGPYIGDVHDALLLAKLLPNTSGEAIYFSDVAFPVKNKDGKTLGVLCTHLNWQWTRDVVRSIEKENSVDIFLLSKDGMVLVGPGDSERKNLSDISKTVATTFKDSQSSYKIVQWHAGQNYLTAHVVSKGFDEYEGFGWNVIVRQPVDQAFAIAQNNSKHIFIASILAAIIGAVVGILISNGILSPLKKLTNDVQELKDGKKVSFATAINNDEVSTLQNGIKELHEGLLKESHLKFEAQEKVNIALKVFDQSIEGILITDHQNKIIMINNSFTTITGYSLEDVYGKNPNLLSSGKNDSLFYDAMWNKIQSSGKWEGKIENKKKDGTFYTEHLKISTLKDNDKVIYYVATFNSSF